MTEVVARRQSLKRRGWFGSAVVDRFFRWGSLSLAGITPMLIVVLLLVLALSAVPAIRHFGWAFLTRSIWDPVRGDFGVLFAIYGTVVSSLLALLLAVPVSLGAAICLSELAPRWLRNPLGFLIELLAAVPSIVYGLWGVFVLVPQISALEVWLQRHFGYLAIFQGPTHGIGMLAAGVILAIMILPYITSVSREVIQAVPAVQREAAYALGATRWETLKGPVLRYARTGIMGAIILGLGRALGETMAVTMVIGNRAEMSASIFSPAYTIPSLLANEFVEADNTLQLTALIEVALVLVAVTILINAVARMLIWRVAKGSGAEARA